MDSALGARGPLPLTCHPAAGKGDLETVNKCLCVPHPRGVLCPREDTRKWVGSASGDSLRLSRPFRVSGSEGSCS